MFCVRLQVFFPEDALTLIHLQLVKRRTGKFPAWQLLNKKLDVIKVKTFDEGSSISRELLLMKVKYNKSNRRDIIEMCEITDNANIVDFSPHTMMIQMCDTTEKIETFMEMFKGISIVEVARTGTLALQKCKETD